jgi:hypothetical protein
MQPGFPELLFAIIEHSDRVLQLRKISDKLCMHSLLRTC